MSKASDDETTTELATWTTDSRCGYHGDSFTFHLGLAHDCRVLFEPADFSLQRGTVTGLVGTNGAGKSSLALAIKSKQLPGFPRNLVVQYISSEDDEMAVMVGAENDDYDDDNDETNDDDDDVDIMNMTTKEYLHYRIEKQLLGLREEINELEEKLETDSNTEEIADQLSDLYDKEDGLVSAADREIEQILDELSFGPHMHKRLKQLSSGWRYRSRLIAAFLVHADLLCIDEPSFLDVQSTTWFISQTKKAAKQDNNMVLLISHKEALLEDICDDHILYINSANQTISQYHCGYSAFREARANEVNTIKSKMNVADEKLNGADKSLKKIQSQLRKREINLKQKTTQDADKRFIKGKNKEAKQKADKSAASKLKQLKKQNAIMEETMKQKSRTERVKPIKITGIVAAGTLAELQEVAVSYNDDDDDSNEFVFENVEVRIEPNDRILLAGSNGCGKTTLIKLLLGKLRATKGICRLNNMSKTLYFPQTAMNDLIRMHGKQTGLDYLAGIGKKTGKSNNKTSITKDNNNNNNTMLTETQIRCHLGDFGLTGATALQPIASLSAGQHVRLWLAKQLLSTTTQKQQQQQPSLLIMDEISENVDIETRQSLTELLNNFIGAVIVVSHDYDFCISFQPTQIWNLTRYGIRIDYP